jgi:hypothetical protein
MGKPKKKKHYKRRNYHHLVPKSRGGAYSDSNLLLIKIERHEHWHMIFGNRTLREVIILLIRLERMKHA